ncbi:helix-turn-helix domain-containing protein, partial [Acidisphaera rubrifaciens]|uniref:helix-turn-helix domain-containing protein n=1 Tax=Acidisphaera rubrifaciens TaxID=50715 RepID=UPI0006621B6B
ARLLAHPWPGNVRELVNAMQRVATLLRRPVVAAADLAFLGDGEAPADEDALPPSWAGLTLPEATERLERALLRRALAEAAGNRTQAAERLGISRQHLYRLLARPRPDLSGEVTDGVAEADDGPGRAG